MSSSTSTEGINMLSTTDHLMSVEAMKAIIWAGFALCFIGFCVRSYIRWVCFRRLLPEDWIMLLALALQLAAACVAQLRLHYVYLLEDVSNGNVPMPPTFVDDVPKALLGIFLQGVISITGVHAVKLSFLLFFRRLGGHLVEYTVFWWVVAFVTFASYAISIALIEYKCMLSSLDVIFFECTANGETARQWTYMIAYCTVDAASDILILCLPIAVLWKVRLSMRKKLILGAIFSLTLLTVAVTIIRGTIHQGKVSEDGTQTQNIAWTWFWLAIQFITAYIIACLVSFRMLFVHNEKKSSAAARAAGHHEKAFPPARPSRSGGGGRSAKKFFDSLLDTFHDWEGTTRDGRDVFVLGGALPSARLSVDFMCYQPGDGGKVYQEQAARGQVQGQGQGQYDQHQQQQQQQQQVQYYLAGGGGGGEGEWPLRDGLDEESGNGGLRRPDSARTLTGSNSGLCYAHEVVEEGGKTTPGPGEGRVWRPQPW